MEIEKNIDSTKEEKYKNIVMSSSVENLIGNLRNIIEDIHFIDPLCEDSEFVSISNNLKNLIEKSKTEEKLPTWKFAKYHNPISGVMNPLSPPLVCSEKEDNTFSVYFNKSHQSMNNIVHGGILSSVFDDVLQKISQKSGKYCATAELVVTFIKPTPINEEIFINGSIMEIHEKKVVTIAEMICNGVITARGKAVMVPIDMEKINKSIPKSNGL